MIAILAVTVASTSVFASEDNIAANIGSAYEIILEHSEYVSGTPLENNTTDLGHIVGVDSNTSNSHRPSYLRVSETLGSTDHESGSESEPSVSIRGRRLANQPIQSDGRSRISLQLPFFPGDDVLKNILEDSIYSGFHESNTTHKLPVISPRMHIMGEYSEEMNRTTESFSSRSTQTSPMMSLAYMLNVPENMHQRSGGSSYMATLCITVFISMLW